MFKIKYNAYRTIQQYKAWLTVKSFYQKLGFWPFGTFRLVVIPSMVWIILILALAYHWHVKQIDFNHAFLNEDL